MCMAFQVKYSLFLSDINETWIFSKDFPKILNYRISWKILPVGAEFFMPMDRRTDMTQLIVAFRNFAKAPKYY
jgi:hypothetical protein